MLTKVILVLMCSVMFICYPSTCDDQQMQELTRNTQLVVVAEIVEVKPAPGFWSGQFAAVQYVHYKIIESLKGNTAGDIEVGHYVVKNSLTADKDRARLSPKLFKVGNRLILFIQTDQRNQKAEPSRVTFLSQDENCGAVLATDHSLQVVRHAL